jgi:hypothetical protein
LDVDLAVITAEGRSGAGGTARRTSARAGDGNRGRGREGGGPPAAAQEIHLEILDRVNTVFEKGFF